MSLIDRCRLALGEERGNIFFSTIQQIGLKDDDPEVLSVFAAASLYIDARDLSNRMVEVLQAFREESSTIQESLSKFSESVGPLVDREVAVAVTKAIDSMHGEIVQMARTTAQSEYQAASVVATAAVNDHVRLLRAATEEFVRAEAAAKVTGGAGAASAAPAAAKGALVLTRAQVIVGCVVTFLLGIAIAVRFVSPLMAHAATHHVR